jgi:hypothetical protein
MNGPVTGRRWPTLLDAMPLVRTANALSGRRWPKLSGNDLINPILESAVGRSVRVGFLVGTIGTPGQLHELVGQRLPAIRAARIWAPAQCVRHIERYRGRAYSALFRAVVASMYVARHSATLHRHSLAITVHRRCRQDGRR